MWSIIGKILEHCSKTYTLKNLVCSPHQIWCARVVQTGTRYMVCCAHLFYGVHSTLNLVCYAHHFWCGKHTLYSVLLHCILPGLTFTHVNLYNIDTIQLQSSHEQYSKCVVLLSNVFVRYFVADIQSDYHAAPPETYA